MRLKRTTREIHQLNKKRKAPDEMGSLVVLLHNIRSMHNTGSAFRSCDALGVGELWLTGYTPAPPRPEISKTALGADETVHWEYREDFDQAYEELKSRGYKFAAAEQTSESELLTEFNTPKNSRWCVIFGNEVTGVDEDVLKKCDIILEVPQYGEKHSFNVSVSIGIFLYHLLLRFSS